MGRSDLGQWRRVLGVGKYLFSLWHTEEETVLHLVFGCKGAPAYDHGAWCRGRSWMIQGSGDARWQGKQASLLSEIK